MLKYIKTKDQKYNGLLYRGRKIIADEKLIERLLKVPEAIVYSSWRSLAEQKELVKQGKSKTLQSNHRRGMAVDVINWKEVQDKMRKVGLINDISWDRNHFAYDGESKATKYPIYDTLPAKLEEYKIAAKKTPEPQKTQDTIQEPKTPQNAIPTVSESSSTGVFPIEAITTTSNVEIIYNQTTPCQKLLCGNLFEQLKRFIQKYFR